MGRNCDDYPGFQPKTTFLYYFAHDCSDSFFGSILIKKLASRERSKENITQRFQIQTNLDLRNPIFPFLNGIIFDLRKIYVTSSEF